MTFRGARWRIENLFKNPSTSTASTHSQTPRPPCRWCYTCSPPTSNTLARHQLNAYLQDLNEYRAATRHLLQLGGTITHSPTALPCA
ncbi:MAG: hypothetical protein ACRDRQ_27345, partial [Pseudonocardiaceae bacterium]